MSIASCCLPLIFALATAARPALQADELRPAGIFGDGMVLQRETLAPVFGFDTPGVTVRVGASWTDDVRETTAGVDGRWKVALETPAAGGPHTVSIQGSSKVEFEDVWSGEVWIASGQSNMQWSVTDSANPEEEIAQANHPHLRLFTVPRTTAMAPAADVEGTWSVCSPDTIAGFSAVAYHFGRNLEAELDVPIGLVSTNWGGTRVEAWTSEAALRAAGELTLELDQIAGLRDGTITAPNVEELQSEWWRKHAEEEQGMNAGWMEAGFDDGAWTEASLPHTWADLGLEAFDGCVWYRRAVELPAELAGRELVLEIGPVDDMDLTWFDGELVGETRGDGSWQTPRSYAIPAELAREGRVVITVCAVDSGGTGRVGNEPEGMRLAAKDGSGALSLAGPWKVHAGGSLAELGAWPRRPSFHANSATALFNGMIAPLVPFAIRGAIWYQGEANVANAAAYRRRFPAMISDWRAHWKQGAFPFYFVQIAPFAYAADTGQAAELREAQALALRTPNTGMAVVMDVGNPVDIHPRDKRTVGRRLALLALANTYGRTDVVASGPVLREHRSEDGGIRLAFDHAEGLTSGADPPTCFTLAGADRVFHPATAVIGERHTILVTSPFVTEPVAVRFAWGAADVPNLRNGAGLPASSFRTDDWPGVSANE